MALAELKLFHTCEFAGARRVAVVNEAAGAQDYCQPEADIIT